MTATVLLLRFAFVALAALVLVAFLAFAGVVSVWLTVSLPLCVGLLAAAYGDRFLTGFPRVFKWLQ